ACGAPARRIRRIADHHAADRPRVRGVGPRAHAAPSAAHLARDPAPAHRDTLADAARGIAAVQRPTHAPGIQMGVRPRGPARDAWTLAGKPGVPVAGGGGLLDAARAREAGQGASARLAAP